MSDQKEKFFQLDPKAFKTGNMILDGAVKSIAKTANTVDLNKNGIPDIHEIAMVGTKVLPLLVVINEAVDFEIAADAVASHPAIKDKVLFAEALKELGKLAEAAQALMPQED